MWIVDDSKRLSAFLRLTSVCIHEFSPHETEDGVPLFPHCLLARSRMNYCLTGLSEFFFFGLLLCFRNKKSIGIIACDARCPSQSTDY